VYYFGRFRFHLQKFWVGIDPSFKTFELIQIWTRNTVRDYVPASIVKATNVRVRSEKTGK
jgi:hypothetical protein